jgi:hypothetical protein
MPMFRFITEKPLWKNILAGFVVSLIILIGFLFTLNIITNHGEYLVIPNVKGKNYKDVQDVLAFMKKAKSGDFRYTEVLSKIKENEGYPKKNRLSFRLS